MTSAASLLFTSSELPGWSLCSEGAAIHESEQTAVIADVHLGYEWARAAGGDMIPAHSLGETIAKLERIFASATIARLVVAGDLVESARPCPRTARDFRALMSWLTEKKVELQWIRGNHDPVKRPVLPLSLMIDGWSISHGDRPVKSGPSIFGHHHPALRAGGLTAPCFLIGRETIALPAFSPNAAGLDILTPRLPSALKRESLRCVAGLGDALLDFGTIQELAAKLGR